MSGLFGGKNTIPQPKPRIDHTSVQAAGDAERRRHRAAAGRASTMFTGGRLPSVNVGTTTLLGR